jgi:hypothetical protein
MAIPQGYFQPTLAPDPEWLSQAYLTAYMGMVPIKTRDTQPNMNQAAAPAFIRVEAGDTHWIAGIWGAAYLTSFVMHSYSPNEIEAAQNSQRAISMVSAATGLKVAGWYIVEVVSVIGGRRLSDPEVPANIVRYRSAVTWKVAGQPLTT